MQYLTYYLAAVNVVLYALMGLDKLFAKLQKRRIPEKTLHKTFAIGFPLLAIIQIAAVVFLVIKFA